MVPVTTPIDFEPHGRVYVAYLLIPTEIMLQTPTIIGELQAQVQAMQADDEEDEAEKAALADQIAALEADDEEDEAEKAQLQEELAAAEEAAAAVQEAAEAEAAAAEEEAAAAAEEMANKIAELTMAGAEQAEASDDLVDQLKANNAELATTLQATLETLKDTQHELAKMKNKVSLHPKRLISS